MRSRMSSRSYSPKAEKMPNTMRPEGVGVDSLLVDVEINMDALKLVHKADKLLDRASKPVYSPDHDHIELASGRSPDELIKGWSLISSFRTADAIVCEFCDDLPAIAFSDATKLQKLVLGSLVRCRDARIDCYTFSFDHTST